MGIEDNREMNETDQDQYYYDLGQNALWHCLRRIESKLDLLLTKEQPRDRQDKEKAIKNSLTEDGWCSKCGKGCESGSSLCEDCKLLGYKDS